jgi:hypothetical protein
VHERKFDLAIQDLNTVLRLRPGVLLVQVQRGEIYEHLGSYSRALADYNGVVSITSSLPLNRALASSDVPRCFFPQWQGGGSRCQERLRRDELERGGLY